VQSVLNFLNIFLFVKCRFFQYPGPGHDGLLREPARGRQAPPQTYELGPLGTSLIIIITMEVISPLDDLS